LPEGVDDRDQGGVPAWRGQIMEPPLCAFGLESSPISTRSRRRRRLEPAQLAGRGSRSRLRRQVARWQRNRADDRSRREPGSA
jgi:hypothetical protein